MGELQMVASASMVLVRRSWRIGFGLVCSLLAALGLYATAVIVCGLIPVNTDFRQSDGVVIYVRGNGVHSDIVIPWLDPVYDWRDEFPQADKLQPFISFSWGDRGFYMETPTWGDLRASIALTALSGLGKSIMRVEFAGPPQTELGDVVLHLSDAQYRRLAAQIRASFQRDADGRPLPMPTPHYAAGLSFYYEAFGSYSLLHTCNDWTRQTLTATGVRMPLWAPFYPSIFYQLRNIPPAGR